MTVCGTLIGKELNATQRRLADARAEISYTAKKSKKRVAPKDELEIVRGDAPSTGGKTDRRSRKRRISWGI